eukprot:3661955-Prorocentrum_lima.AAC.1
MSAEPFMDTRSTIRRFSQGRSRISWPGSSSFTEGSPPSSTASIPRLRYPIPSSASFSRRMRRATRRSCRRWFGSSLASPFTASECAQRPWI